MGENELMCALEDYQIYFRYKLTVYARVCLNGSDEYLVGRLRKAIDTDTPIADDDYTFYLRSVPGRVY